MLARRRTCHTLYYSATMVLAKRKDAGAVRRALAEAEKQVGRGGVLFLCIRWCVTLWRGLTLPHTNAQLPTAQHSTAQQGAGPHALLWQRSKPF